MLRPIIKELLLDQHKYFKLPTNNNRYISVIKLSRVLSRQDKKMQEETKKKKEEEENKERRGWLVG